MDVKVLNKRDASDPLNEAIIIAVTDGAKEYKYRIRVEDMNYDCHAALERGLSEALDDLLYHDGVKGRVVV